MLILSLRLCRLSDPRPPVFGAQKNYQSCSDPAQGLTSQNSRSSKKTYYVHNQSVSTHACTCSCTQYNVLHDIDCSIVMLSLLSTMYIQLSLRCVSNYSMQGIVLYCRSTPRPLGSFLLEHNAQCSFNSARPVCAQLLCVHIPVVYTCICRACIYSALYCTM